MCRIIWPSSSVNPSKASRLILWQWTAPVCKWFILVHFQTDGWLGCLDQPYKVFKKYAFLVTCQIFVNLCSLANFSGSFSTTHLELISRIGPEEMEIVALSLNHREFIQQVADKVNNLCITAYKMKDDTNDQKGSVSFIHDILTRRCQQFCIYLPQIYARVDIETLLQVEWTKMLHCFSSFRSSISLKKMFILAFYLFSNVVPIWENWANN